MPTMTSMRLTLNVVRAKNVNFQITSLRTTFRTIRNPGDMYFVPPGKDIRETKFSLPFAGKIHAMGTHIHPYGVSIELFNVTRNEQVWKAVGERDANGTLVKMPVYQNPVGYAVGKEDQFKLIATYDNPTQKPVDAMAGVFVLYTPQ